MCNSKDYIIFVQLQTNTIMKRNKNIGARVKVKKLTVEINPTVGWRTLKNVTGVIVENKGYEHYYHTCIGGHKNVKKHLIENDYCPNYAVKLDNNVRDVEGNNIIIVYEHELVFLEIIEEQRKPVSEKAYLSAKKIIERYEREKQFLMELDMMNNKTLKITGNPGYPI